MRTIVKILICMTAYLSLRESLSDTFSAGYITGTAVMALMVLVDHFANGWNRGKSRGRA